MLLNSSRARAGRNKSEIFNDLNSKHVRIIRALYFLTELILRPLLCILCHLLLHLVVGAASSRDRDLNKVHIAAGSRSHLFDT